MITGAVPSLSGAGQFCGGCETIIRNVMFRTQFYARSIIQEAKFIYMIDMQGNESKNRKFSYLCIKLVLTFL